MSNIKYLIDNINKLKDKNVEISKESCFEALHVIISGIKNKNIDTNLNNFLFEFKETLNKSSKPIHTDIVRYLAVVYLFSCIYVDSIHKYSCINSVSCFKQVSLLENEDLLQSLANHDLLKSGICNYLDKWMIPVYDDDIIDKYINRDFIYDFIRNQIDSKFIELYVENIKDICDNIIMNNEILFMSLCSLGDTTIPGHLKKGYLLSLNRNDIIDNAPYFPTKYLKQFSKKQLINCFVCDDSLVRDINVAKNIGLALKNYTNTRNIYFNILYNKLPYRLSNSMNASTISINSRFSSYLNYYNRREVISIINHIDMNTYNISHANLQDLCSLLIRYEEQWITLYSNFRSLSGEQKALDYMMLDRNSVVNKCLNICNDTILNNFLLRKKIKRGEALSILLILLREPELLA